MPPEAPAAAAPPPPAPTIPPAPAASPRPDAPVDGQRLGLDKKPLHEGVPSLLSKLFDDVSVDGKAKDKGKGKDKADAPAAPAKPADGALDPAKPDGDKPIAVRRKKVERPALPIDDAPAPAPAPRAQAAPAPAAAEGDETTFRAGLEENEREMLEDAEWLEKRDPAQYRGLGERTKKFLRDHAAMVEAPDFQDHGGEEGDEYKQFLAANQPKLTRAQQREIQEGRIADRVRGEYDGKFKDQQFEIFASTEEPRIRQDGDKLYLKLASTAMPKEIADGFNAAVKARGQEAAIKEYKLELDVARPIMQAAVEDIKELRRIGRVDSKTGRQLQAEAMAPHEPKFQQHERLRNLFKHECESFLQNGGAALQQNGRWFVTRDEMATIRQKRPDLAGKYWTFTVDQIVERALARIPQVIKDTVALKRKDFEGYGFWRDAAPAAAAPAAPAKPSSSGLPRPGPIPGAGARNDLPTDGARLAAILRGQAS